ncbi:MAG: FliM/FliN family flagellar motor switch protein [Rhodocyclaceae bacterium]
MNDIRERIPAADGSESAVHPIAYEEIEPRAQQSAPIVTSMNPLHRLKAQVTVRIGGAEMTVGELMALQEQQLLVLDRHLNAPVDVTVEGSVIAQGELVAVDDRFAVKVTRLPAPLKG